MILVQPLRAGGHSANTAHMQDDIREVENPLFALFAQ